MPTVAGKVYKYELREQIGANRHEWKGFVRDFFKHEQDLKTDYYEKYLTDKKVSAAIAKAMLIFNFCHCLGYELVEIEFTVKPT